VTCFASEVHVIARIPLRIRAASRLHVGLLVVWLVSAVLAGTVTRAEIPAEPLNRNTELGAPGVHWAWTLDFDVHDLAKSRYVLFDGDDVSVKGMLGTGSFPTMHPSPDGRWLYVAESWLLGPRKIREDYVTVYDARTLRIDAVIELPGARRALMAPTDRSALTADGELLVIFNFKPGTSLTVVDVIRREVVAHELTPGCSLVYPSGQRGVSMICGDGSLLTLHFDATGRVARRHRSAPFFDPDVDPLIENGVPLDGRWLFTTYGGSLHAVDLSGEQPVFDTPWALVDRDAKPAGWLASLLTMGRAGPWKPGGYQLMTVHPPTGRLFVLTHPVTWSGGEGDHVFPGAEVWVYDVAAQERIDRIRLRDVGISIHVTPDDEPLLLVGSADIETEAPGLEVYDADTGRFLRSMDEPGTAMLHFMGVAGR
jgi:methylamine dehydrogenase heavy chain